MLDPPLTSLPFVAPSFSSTPITTRDSDSTFLTSPFPLAQWIGLEMGETSRGDGNVIEDVSFLRSKELTLIAPHLEEAPFVEFDGNLTLNSDTPSIEHIDPICSKLFDSTSTSSRLLPTTPSYLLAFHESVGDLRGYNPSFDRYCAYLEDVPQKIMWSTFFDHTFYFSMAFDEFKRPLTLFTPSFLVFSHSHHSEMHATTYDKLLRALKSFEWSDLSMDVRLSLDVPTT